MAAPVLKAELKLKDGKTTSFAVETENNLKSLVAGVKKLNAEISVVLTGLVEEERSLRGDSDGNDLEEEDEESDEEENAPESNELKSGPPAKRLKT